MIETAKFHLLLHKPSLTRTSSVSTSFKDSSGFPEGFPSKHGRGFNWEFVRQTEGFSDVEDV